MIGKSEKESEAGPPAPFSVWMGFLFCMAKCLYMIWK